MGSAANCIPSVLDRFGPFRAGLEFHFFLACSGVQNVWVNGVQNSCVNVSPVKHHGNSNYMGGGKYV